jgi:hypothetical protein
LYFSINEKNCPAAAIHRDFPLTGCGYYMPTIGCSHASLSLFQVGL